ncbi:hypothetical protein ACVWZR_008746 [Bradyrhizobium sp. i1.3.1]
MGIDPLRQRNAGRHQECGPVDRVEADDVLADDVHVGRPVAPVLVALVGESDAGDVIGQRVDPDIHHVLFVAGHFHAPIEGRARDREIAQAAAYEAHHLVLARVRANEFRMIFVELQKLVLIGRQAEEIALLLDPFDWRALRSEAHAVVVQARLVLGVIRLVAHRVPAGIAVGVDVAVRFHAPPDLLAGAMVLLFGGADEAVERHVQTLVHLLEAASIAGRERGRGQALVLRGLDHLLTVLVGAGQEEHVLAVEPRKARQHVGRDRLIGVADMRAAVGIGDGGRDVEDVVARGRSNGSCGLRSCDGLRRGRRLRLRHLGLRHLGLHNLRRRGDRSRCCGHGRRGHFRFLGDLLCRRSLALRRRLGCLFGRFLHRLLGDDLLLRSLLAGLLCRLRSAFLHALLDGSLLGLLDLLGSFARERLHGLLHGLVGSLLLAALAPGGFLSSRGHDEFLYRLLEIWKRTCVRSSFGV